MLEGQKTTSEILLGTWAVVGPLIAAAASAVWSRFTQVRDREFHLKSENERQLNEDKRESTLHLRTMRKEKYEETKSAIAELLGASHEYVRKQSMWLSNNSPESLKAASDSNDRFIYSSQNVILLVDDDLADTAISLWNATIAIPIPYNKPHPDNYDELISTYRKTRSKFISGAREFLKKIEPAAPNP